MPKDVRVKNSQLIKRALTALERKGKLTPDDVVRAARDPNNALHEYFDWDDSVAGQKWRIQQARHLIASVQVTVTFDHKVLCCPVYVRDPNAPGHTQGYVSSGTLSPTDQRATLLEEIAMVEAALARALALAARFGLTRMVEALTARVRAFRGAVERQPRASA
jgi:hypothetical protein